MMLIKYFFETILYVHYYIFLFSKLYFFMYFKFIIIYIDDM